MVENFDNVIKSDVLGLLHEAGNYAHCTVEELDRCVLDAFRNKKALVWASPYGHMMGFMTWAALPPDKAKMFMTDGICPSGDDYLSEEGEMWVVDFVAPYGSVGQMVRDARAYFGQRYGDGVTFNWKRDRRSTGFKLGYAIAREKKDGLVQ